MSYFKRKWLNLREHLMFLLPKHKFAHNKPDTLRPFVKWLRRYTDLPVNNIFEIGANYCQDAAGLQYMFQLPDSSVWAFEAHPDIVAEARKLYKFNIIHTAVSNKHGIVEFNCVPLTKKNSGTSSILESSILTYDKKIQAECIRMDDFLREKGIKEIDFLKIDVEGSSYEVLEGFGNRLADVKAIHVEHEHEPVWNGQKLFEDIEILLKEYGFVMVWFQRYNSQSDSFWVQKRYIKSKTK